MDLAQVREQMDLKDTAFTRKWAASVAERYLGDCRDWPTDRLLSEIEVTGYELARDGRSSEATSLFVAVAELSKHS